MNREATIQPFEVADLDSFEAMLEKGAEFGDFEKRLKKAIALGEAKTIYYWEKILGVIGYTELWPGVCEVWAIPVKELEFKGVYILIVRDALNKLIDSNKFHRVQATAEATETNEKFFRKLGFMDEGVLKQYSMHRQDYKMWARVK